MTVQERPMSPLLLVVPITKGWYNASTDAWERQLNAVLLEEQPDGQPRPFGYWYRSLAHAESLYTSSEREYLAMMQALLFLHPFFEESRFTFCSDHYVFCWKLHFANATGKCSWWRLRLFEYKFDVRPSTGCEALCSWSTLGIQSQWFAT